jgi:hypothetical protein
LKRRRIEDRKKTIIKDRNIERNEMKMEQRKKVEEKEQNVEDME